MIGGRGCNGELAAAHRKRSYRRMAQEVTRTGAADLTGGIRVRNARTFAGGAEVRLVGIQRGFLLDVCKGQRTAQHELNGESAHCDELGNELASVLQTELL